MARVAVNLREALARQVIFPEEEGPVVQDGGDTEPGDPSRRGCVVYVESLRDLLRDGLGGVEGTDGIAIGVDLEDRGGAEDDSSSWGRLISHLRHDIHRRTVRKGCRQQWSRQ